MMRNFNLLIVKSKLLSKQCESLTANITKGSCSSSTTTTTTTTTTTQNKKVVFSGIQPTGVPHLGNYFGAIEQWPKLQDDETKKCIFSMVNLHSLTASPIDPNQIRTHTYIMLSCLLACGLDPNRSILFRQGDVQEHASLCWMLSCHFTMSALTRLPAFKEKSEQLQAKKIQIPVGLFLYPCLQAADIMLYKTNLVPIGKDNQANLHLAQDMIEKFNTIHNCNFPKPEVLINEEVACIKSLREPEKKMSKSDSDPLSKIMILDDSDQVINKIKKAKTDFQSNVTYEPTKRPGVSNLVLLHSLITGKSTEQCVQESVNLDTGKYKIVLGEQLVEFLKPIRLKALELQNDQSYLDSILQQGAQKAQVIASQTLDEVSNLLGLK